MALRIPTLVAVVALTSLASACGRATSESGRAVATYVGHLHAGREEQAYAMLAAETRERLSLEQWRQAMHTDMLADASEVSMQGLQTLDPGGTCVYTQLDFDSHRDQGPYGYYIFYLREEAGQPRILHVQTYDRIEGEGLVKTGHFDESREPFPCSVRAIH